MTKERKNKKEEKMIRLEPRLTVTISNKHLKNFYRHNLPETAVTILTNETSEKKWTSSLETTETVEMNRKLMKRTVTISNKPLQIFCRLNLPETAVTSVTKETGLKKMDIFY